MLVAQVLQSYSIAPIVTVQTGKAVFLQSKFIQKHKNVYCCVGMLPIALSVVDMQHHIYFALV